jgi:hypothetical protein
MGAMLTFRGTCGHDVQVPDELAGRPVRCPYCHSVLTAPEAIPYAMPVTAATTTAAPPTRGIVAVEGRRSTPLKVLYLVSLIAGGIAVAAIYLVFFNDLSEEELVALTPFWAFPIAFGFYGYVSQRLLRYLEDGRASSLYEAAKFVVDHAGKWSILPLLPFLALRWRSSLLVTLVASVTLAAFLWVFFAVIFPEL